MRQQTSGVNFSFNAHPTHPCSNLADIARFRSSVPGVLGEPNFNASEKGQTWPYYFADHFAPVRETPQDITTLPLPSSFPFITSHRPNSPLYRFTLSPKSWNSKLERASRDSRSRGESFERSMGEWLQLRHRCWNSSCFGGNVSSGTRRCFRRHSIC